jgi:hypothetical protein
MILFLQGHPRLMIVFLLMEICFSVSRELGIPIEEKKTVGPTTVLDFLGFTIDTLHIMVKIPQDKLVRLRISLLDVLTKKKITLKNLESVTV